MPRNRASAKKAGTNHETNVTGFLAVHVDNRIERRARNGSKDRGDISGVRHMGIRVVLECKDYGGRFTGMSTWLNEAEVERLNDNAGACLVVAKRRGTTDPGRQVVITTLRDLVALLTGVRPEES